MTTLLSLLNKSHLSKLDRVLTLPGYIARMIESHRGKICTETAPATVLPPGVRYLAQKLVERNKPNYVLYIDDSNNVVLESDTGDKRLLCEDILSICTDLPCNSSFYYVITLDGEYQMRCIHTRIKITRGPRIQAVCMLPHKLACLDLEGSLHIGVHSEALRVIPDIKAKLISSSVVVLHVITVDNQLQEYSVEPNGVTLTYSQQLLFNVCALETCNDLYPYVLSDKGALYKIQDKTVSLVSQGPYIGISAPVSRMQGTNLVALRLDGTLASY